LSPSTTYDFYVRWAFSTTTPSPYIYAAQTTTLLATPATPSITSESTSTIGLTWSQNGNPSTTPYAVYNVTLGQYHLADGTLSATPTFYPLSSWNGKAKGLTPATLYTFKIVLRNENGTQYATSTNAGGTYTFNANGTPISLGGSPSTVGSTTTNTTSTVSGGTSWYFGTPGSTTTMTTASQPTTTQLPIYDRSEDNFQTTLDHARGFTFPQYGNDRHHRTRRNSSYPPKKHGHAPDRRSR
jgi:hypothetical protein